MTLWYDAASLYVHECLRKSYPKVPESPESPGKSFGSFPDAGWSSYREAQTRRPRPRDVLPFIWQKHTESDKCMCCSAVFKLVSLDNNVYHDT